MKKVLVAVACLLAGMALAAVVLPMMGVDLWWLGGYDHRSYDITEGFHSVTIQGGPCDVDVFCSYDGQGFVAVTERRPATQIEVIDGVLTVTRPQKLAWYERIHLFTSQEPYISVGLPGPALDDLTVMTGSGDVYVGEDVAAENAVFYTDSGDVSAYAAVGGDLEIGTASGDVYVSGMSPRTVSVSTASGDVSMDSVTAEGAVTATASSGDVWLWDCDGASFDLSAASGDITGYFLTPKRFQASSSSGDVHVPPSVDGGTVTASAASGGVWLEITEE